MNVLIVGAGIAGLTLGLCLQRRGLRVVIAEKSAALRAEGYMMDFFGPGYDVGEALGLLPELEKIHYPTARLRFVRPDGSQKFSVPYSALRKLLDNRHFNFMRGELDRLLYAHIADQTEIRFGTTVTSLRHQGARVEVTFSDGSDGSFDLLVGADGIHSQVRALAFGDEARFSRYMGYVTASYVTADPGLPLVDRDAFTTLTEPGRQVALYPIRGNRLATFFLHRSFRNPSRLDRDAARAELQRVYAGMGWVVPRLLDESRHVEDLYWDSVAQIEMPRWSTGRVVLVGDACQCVSLLAGQGTSLAMAGASVLADELADRGSEVTGWLERYERRMRPTIDHAQRAGRRMARWFVPNSRAGLVVRDAVTRTASWPPLAPLLRRQFGAGATKL